MKCATGFKFIKKIKKFKHAEEVYQDNTNSVVTISTIFYWRPGKLLISVINRNIK